MSVFSFVQISDHHLGASEQTLRKGFLPAVGFRAVLRDIAVRWADQIDFVVSTGDLVLGATVPEYENVCRMLNLRFVSPPPGPQQVSAEGLVDFPMYFIPGNHDDAAQLAQSLFRHDLAGDRLHVTFQHGGVHFVCPDWGPEEPGGIGPDTSPQLVDWLAGAIPANEPTIILTHYAPLLLPGRWQEDMVPRNLERFWRVLEGRRNILAIVVGHIHQTFEAEVHGHRVLGVASTCYQQLLHEGEYIRALLPLAYRLLHIEDGRLDTQVCEVDLPLGRRHEMKIRPDRST
jgi:Icc protein